MRLLYVAAMGDIGTEVLDPLEQSLAGRFHAAVRRITLASPEFARDEQRAQYGSVPVLRMLAERYPRDAWKLLGITAHDLFIPMLTFVYGQAQLDGGTALISLARLRQEFYGMPPDPALLATRALKESMHELGHTMGLVHCADSTCAMALSTALAQLDRKMPDYCHTCAARLARRLQPATESLEI